MTRHAITAAAERYHAARAGASVLAAARLDQGLALDIKMSGMSEPDQQAFAVKAGAGVAASLQMMRRPRPTDRRAATPLQSNSPVRPHATQFQRTAPMTRIITDGGDVAALACRLGLKRFREPGAESLSLPAAGHADGDDVVALARRLGLRGFQEPDIPAELTAPSSITDDDQVPQ